MSFGGVCGCCDVCKEYLYGVYMNFQVVVGGTECKQITSGYVTNLRGRGILSEEEKA